jgi:hypothetical protein
MASLEHLVSSEDSYKVLVPGRGNIGNVGAVKDMISYLLTIEQTVLDHAEQGISPADLTSRANDLMTSFPTNTLPVDWMANEITRGLERAYEQLIVADEDHVFVPADGEPY